MHHALSGLETGPMPPIAMTPITVDIDYRDTSGGDDPDQSPASLGADDGIPY